MGDLPHLGELEQLVLLAVLRLGPRAVASAVREELADRAGRRVARGAIYITLDRLVTKRCLSSRLGDASSDRGGRANRYFTLTQTGRAALRATRETLLRLWSGYESALEER